MTMKFLSKAHSQALRPKTSMAKLLAEGLRGAEPRRSLDEIHASDVTKPDFCPKQVALLQITDKTLPGEWINASLRYTFDMGEKTADLIREKWLGEHAKGNWECLKCHESHTMCSKPPAHGGDCKHLWKYRETAWKSEFSGITGSADVLVEMGGPKWKWCEMKIIAAGEWETIVAPLAEHRIRTSLYLRLVAESSSVWRDHVDTREAIVLYTSRGAGRKHEELKEVLPFKEFVVQRDDKSTQDAWEKGKAVKVFREGGEMPKGICPTITSPRAQKCPVAKECFGVVPL